MSIQHLIVAAFVLYAVFYLGRYCWRVMKGKKTGCGCGSEAGCAKTGAANPKK